MARPRRISVAPKAHSIDSYGRHLHQELIKRFPKIELESIHTARCYTVAADLSERALVRLAQTLTNSVIETYAVDRVLAPERFAYTIEIGYLPGVTDSVGTTAREMAQDALKREFGDDGRVYSSLFFFLVGEVTQAQAKQIADELHNPLIQRAQILSRKEFGTGTLRVVAPNVSLTASTKVDTISLDLPDDELIALGRQGIKDTDGTRRGPLALSLQELHAIRNYFKKQGRVPTDIELESLAQTWSEHCKHTIFSDPLDDIHDGIYKHYIRGATEKIRKAKGKKDICVSVFSDNSGAIAFDDEYLVTHKVETHNSPSALDPFGGAVTGIGGVNRDALGFGLGAKPIANVYGFCVGEPTDTRVLYRDKKRTQKLLSPRRILSGVVAGINAGGNQSGIPTPLGFVYTDERYRGKPLVFAGTVGFIPRTQGKRNLHEKRARPGDYVVVIGNRVGLDGIHGATFSSEALASGSPATAVQIGAPIIQKRLSDALIREARDQALYTSITDNGAGGISCSVAEMAQECGGAEVDITTVPLKYPGLAPWQIWISESQERMTLAVPKTKWPAFKKLMDSRDVEATRIGTFTNSGRCIVTSHGKILMDLELSFLHDGRKRVAQKSAKPKAKKFQPVPTPAAKPAATLLSLLSRTSVGSTVRIAEQYDYEVQALSVTKPLQGRGRVNATTGVLAPRLDSNRGIVLADAYYPSYTELDPYKMALAAVDTAVRNAIATGADPERIAILDNFCWSSGSSPERLWQLKEAARGCYDGAVAHGTPFISGKDSMFNDFKGFDENGKPLHIQAPPTLLISALGIMKDVRTAVTLDLKLPGDLLYLIGDTAPELGGSEYARMLSVQTKKQYGGTVPMTNLAKNAEAYRALARAIEQGLVAATLGVDRGGLAAAAAKMAIAGQLGVHISLKEVPTRGSCDDVTLLYSESQGRVLVAVAPEKSEAFEKLLTGVRYACVGSALGEKRMLVSGKSGTPLMSVLLTDATAAYHAPLVDL